MACNCKSVLNFRGCIQTMCEHCVRLEFWTQYTAPDLILFDVSMTHGAGKAKGSNRGYAQERPPVLEGLTVKRGVKSGFLFFEALLRLGFGYGELF